VELVKVIITPFNTSHIHVDCKLNVKVTFSCYITGGSSLRIGPQRKPHNLTTYRCACDYQCKQEQGVDIESHVEVFDPGKLAMCKCICRKL